MTKIEIKLNVVAGSTEHHKLIAFLHDNLYEFSSKPNGTKPLVMCQLILLKW
jgi:hypothetical protein